VVLDDDGRPQRIPPEFREAVVRHTKREA
jgi:hypothetical protein